MVLGESALGRNFRGVAPIRRFHCLHDILSIA
jgi:hypothetical protein